MIFDTQYDKMDRIHDMRKNIIDIVFVTGKLCFIQGF